MSLIGSLVVGISANVSSLKKGMDEARAGLKGMRKSLREVQMITKGAGMFALGRQVLGSIASMTHEFEQLGIEAKRTGLSVDQLSHGLVTDVDVARVGLLSDAFEDLGRSIKLAIGTAGEGGFADWMADWIDADIALLTGSTVEKVRGERAGAKIAKSGADAREHIEKESLARRAAAEKEFLSGRSSIAEQLKKQQDEIFGLTNGEGALASRQFAESGASTTAEFRQFEENRKRIDELNAAKERAKEEEKARIAEIKEAEQEAARAEEDANARAAKMFEEVQTPQEKYIAKLWEIHDLAKQRKIDEETFHRQNQLALDERNEALEKDQDLSEPDQLSRRAGLAGVATAGSSDAFSAIARFQSQREKVPQQQLKEARETNRLLRRSENSTAVVENLN